MKKFELYGGIGDCAEARRRHNAARAPTGALGSGSENRGQADRQEVHGEPPRVLLIAGRAKRAQLYPRAFSQAACEGITAQKGLHLLGLLHSPLMSVDGMSNVIAMLTGARTVADTLHEDAEMALDNQSVAKLDPNWMRSGRKKKSSTLGECISMLRRG